MQAEADTDLQQNTRSLSAYIEALSSKLVAIETKCDDDSFLEELTELLGALHGLKECVDYRPLAAGIDGRRTWLHDFRNHLNIVKGYAELVLEYEQANSYVIRPLINDILKLVQSLLPETAESAGSDLSENAGLAQGDGDQRTAQLLVVEDDDKNRLLLVKTLRAEGHSVIEACNASEAFEKLEEHAIELILLDLNLPDMNGFDVLQQLKKKPKLRSIPVIMVSGQHEQESAIRCIESGAEEYLTKPVNQTMLRARIEGSLFRKSWRDREQQYTSELAQSHAFIRKTFGRYTSEQIVDRLLEDPQGLELGGRLQDVSILMSDISSFTTMCEELLPQEVVQLVNNYLGTLSEVLFAHDGTIDEFIGDAILAIFGAPLRADDDADRATQCAIAMQNEMHVVNAINERHGLPSIETAIAINSGSVVAGNIGSQRRSKFAVVGQPVNLTGRIEEVTRAGEILISDSTRALLKQPYHFGASRTFQAKGFNQQTRVHVVHCSPQEARDKAEAANTAKSLPAAEINTEGEHA